MSGSPSRLITDMSMNYRAYSGNTRFSHGNGVGIGPSALPQCELDLYVYEARSSTTTVRFSDQT